MQNYCRGFDWWNAQHIAYYKCWGVIDFPPFNAMGYESATINRLSKEF